MIWSGNDRIITFTHRDRQTTSTRHNTADWCVRMKKASVEFLLSVKKGKLWKLKKNLEKMQFKLEATKKSLHKEPREEEPANKRKKKAIKSVA